MSGEIEVRRLEEQDLAAVAELERLSFAEPWSERALAYLLGESALGVVCLCEGRVVAYGGMQLVLDEGQITNIAVAPDCRRCGYGLAVMEAGHFYTERPVLSYLADLVKAADPTVTVEIYDTPTIQTIIK